MTLVTKLRTVYFTSKNIRLLAPNRLTNCLTQLSQRRFESSHSFKTVDEEDEILKRDILNLALNHVNHKGWTREALKAATTDLGISSEVSNIFNEYDLVHFFISRSNEELETHLEASKLNLRDALEWRLRKIVPYASNYNQALAFATKPENLPKSIQLLQNMADTIAHYSLNDKATNFSWYTKRVGVASIYVATELHLIQDESEECKETWSFLTRRVKDFENCQQGTLLPLTNSLPEVVSIGVTTLSNMLGRNRNR